MSEKYKSCCKDSGVVCRLHEDGVWGAGGENDCGGGMMEEFVVDVSSKSTV